MSHLLLSTAYFPNVYYMALLIKHGGAVMEQYEHFPKQTYRNRCSILSANGVLDLVVPVKKPHGSKTFTKNIEISYETPWQRLHKNAFDAAYKSSPFYEYLEWDFKPVFEERFKTLLELNAKVLEIICSILEESIEVSYTQEYKNDGGVLDFRECIHPKKPIQNVTFPAYNQVFDDKYPFQPNLSFVDLLFNKGMESLLILLFLQ